MKTVRTKAINYIVHILRSVAHIANASFNYYVLNQWERSIIHNDLGASFTTISRQGKHIIKKSVPEGEEKLKKEIEWYVANTKKKTKWTYCFPKIYSYSLTSGNTYYDMRYYNLPNLRKVIVENSNTRAIVHRRIKFIISFMAGTFYKKGLGVPCPEGFIQKSYINKYSDRMATACSMSTTIKKIVSSDFIKINGKKHLSPSLILNGIKDNEEILNKLTPKNLYPSHGDMHSNNILCGILPSHLIFLDARGESPLGEQYFDPGYDIGKLYHDFHGFYSLIEKKMYTLFYRQEEKSIEINYAFNSSNVERQFRLFYFYTMRAVQKKLSRFKNIHYQAVFAEAMHFLTMIPFHLKTEEEGVICLSTGIVNLNKWLKRYHGGFYKQLVSKVTLNDSEEGETE